MPRRPAAPSTAHYQFFVVVRDRRGATVARYGAADMSAANMLRVAALRTAHRDHTVSIVRK